MNSNLLIEKMKKRQRELINSYLPPTFLKEYNALESHIEAIQQAVALVDHMEEIAPTPSTKQRLVKFLEEVGTADITEMTNAVGVSRTLISATLSQNKGTFTNVSKGVWKLAEKEAVKATPVNGDKLSWTEEQLPF